MRRIDSLNTYGKRINCCVILLTEHLIIESNIYSHVFWRKNRMRPPKNITSDLPGIPYRQCPAKTWQRQDNKIVLGQDVFTHCLIVGHIARRLIALFPVTLRRVLFPSGSALSAASHDVGKVSPTFAEKLLRALGDYLPNTPPALRHSNPSLEAQWGGHAGVSQLTLAALRVPPYVAEIAGQHHGFSPPVAHYHAAQPVFGGETWQAERAALLAALQQEMQEPWPALNPAQARVLAGLTTVADWIGSGAAFNDPAQPWGPNIDPALAAAGFMPFHLRPGLSFAQIFGFSPHPAQQQLVAGLDGPGVYLLEAPMGMGKTEAALYAAYTALQAGYATGIYFALPTQLTSNKIYERFTPFLNAILAEEGPNRRALLLHSQAWLAHTALGEEGEPGQSWFDQSKRGLLAPFAVGTLDQALMAAMHVKHGFVRAFGLAGKVVILDEVHTYDAYTGTIMDALVALLKALHCTVIVLSATLSNARRAALLGQPVCGDRAAAHSRSPSSLPYPLISALSANGLNEVPLTPPPSHRVALAWCREAEAREEALRRAEAGQQVLWIENSVADAQTCFLDLAARAAAEGVACGLLHSRYTAADRQQREAEWVTLFGKTGHTRRGLQGRILFGSPVLEQSLDCDADFLITRFCPTDMLLQRLGRLWRHRETPRPAEARCEAWIIAPDLHAACENPALFGRSRSVYSPYVLCRSLEVWSARTHLTLPEDIRPLIEATYSPRPEQGAMRKWLHQLDHGVRGQRGRLALQQLARLSLSFDGITLPEHKAATRYSETESADLLLLRQIRFLPGQHATQLTLLDGRVLHLPHRRSALNPPEWRALAATLAQQVVRVPAHQAPAALPRRLLAEAGFHHCFSLGDPAQDEALLRVARVNPDGSMQGWQCDSLNERYRLDYSLPLGFRAREYKEMS